MSDVSAEPFIPRQLKSRLPFDGKQLEILEGQVSNEIARQILDRVTLQPNARIHDNGCGHGPVTEEILRRSPPAGTVIQATDIFPQFLQWLQEKLKANPSWPVVASQMDACDQKFQDNTFTLSISSFVFAGLQNDVGAAQHILRTLKPGDTGVVSIWDEMPWLDGLIKAHRVLRGDNAPLSPVMTVPRDTNEEHLVKVLKQAAWKDVRTEKLDAWLRMKDLKEWATIAWGFLGAPKGMEGGWTQDDEDQWDKAVDTIVEYIDSEEEWHKVVEGEHRIRMVATVAFVEK